MARNRRRARDRRQADPEPVTGNTAGSSSIDPLGHAAPDAEIAQAQLAVGRPDLAEVPDAEELEAFEEQESGRGRPHTGAAVEHREPRQPTLSRLGGFLRGSWRELQRVQWPDRPQVMQATGVVLGFVLAAGVFLGVADLVSSKLITFILK